MIGALIAVAAIAATTPADTPERGRALDALVACRAITDGARRLACFDRETATLDAALQSRKVLVLDQEQVKKTRRSLFGFSLPSLKLFGDGDGGKQDEVPELRRIDTAVAGSSRLSDGRIAFSVEDGARWVQDDDRTLMLARIKAGTKVRISRASLGSYFASFEGGGSARVRRER